VGPPDECFARWLRSLEERHLADLAFPRVSSALRALSSTYVERRARLTHGAALAGAGKRAAFALFYAPLHCLIVRAIVLALPGARDAPATLVDLGCGTGAAGAAWAAAAATPMDVIGIDRHPWALGEAARTYREIGLRARVRRSNLAAARLPERPAAILAAWTINELADGPRDRLLERLLHRRRASRVLIVEPVASVVDGWWNGWRGEFLARGGREDEWRLRTELPAIVAKLDRAAGLDHRELTARSLWLAG